VSEKWIKDADSRGQGNEPGVTPPSRGGLLFS
jgi:hypothetical protein